MKVKLYTKYYVGFPLLELDVRRIDKIRPGKKGIEGFYSEDAQPSLKRALCIYLSFLRLMLCIEITYATVNNGFVIRKELRRIVKDFEKNS